jgi:predicted lipoprotein with Yx(FWY)xxD motif
MIRIRTAMAVSAVAVGAMSLTACSSGAGGAAQPAAQPAGAVAATSTAGSAYDSSDSSGGANANGDTLSAQMQYQNGTAKQNNAPADTGDFYSGQRTDPAALNWVQLSAGSANGLSPIVHDGAGFTMYRFDKDTPNPSASHCDGQCAVTWPPVLVRPGSKVFVDGVPVKQIGVIKRDDGTLQLTIGHWPIYRFSKDTAPGQTNGEGVGGIWFAVSPTGKKVLPADGSVPSGASSSSASAPSSAASSSSGGSAVTLGNGSVILDSGTNFSEPNGSEGVAGPGCVNVRQPDAASSLQLSGGPIKIWTGPDCSGTSHVVTADVPDLGAIGFDKKIVSIRFGG